jgi:hypothetical protein
MSRINLEDSLFSDGRVLAMASSIGPINAYGMLVLAFRLAQTFYIQGTNIPDEIFNASGLFDLTKFGLAEKMEDGFYIKGSKEQFAWLDQKKEAGRKGGEKKAENRLKDSERLANPSTATVSLEQKASGGYPPTPTPTPTPTKIHNTLVVSDKLVTDCVEINAEPTFERKANQIAIVWNDMAEQFNLPKVKLPLSKDRLKKLKEPLSEFTKASEWVDIIFTVPDNDFNLGVNDRKWKANFDWLLHTTKFNYRKLWEARIVENI